MKVFYHLHDLLIGPQKTIVPDQIQEFNPKFIEK